MITRQAGPDKSDDEREEDPHDYEDEVDDMIAEVVREEDE